MATDGPTPKPCDGLIYREGYVVYQTTSISSNLMEKWVRKIAADSGQRVDWHFAGGRAIVKALGDHEKVFAALNKHLPEIPLLQAASERREVVGPQDTRHE